MIPLSWLVLAAAAAPPACPRSPPGEPRIAALWPDCPSADPADWLRLCTAAAPPAAGECDLPCEVRVGPVDGFATHAWRYVWTPSNTTVIAPIHLGPDQPAPTSQDTASRSRRTPRQAVLEVQRDAFGRVERLHTQTRAGRALTDEWRTVRYTCDESGDDRPPVFTESQLRDAFPVGRAREFSLDRDGETFGTMRWEVLAADANGMTMRTSGPGRHRGEDTITWRELASHTAFPRDHTTIEDAQMETPWGTLDVRRYTVTTAAGDEQTVSIYVFSAAHPGPPLLVEEWRGATPLRAMRLVALD